MDVALRKGNFDSGRLELVPDAQKNVALDIAEPAFGVRNPQPQFMVDRAVAEG